MSSKKTSGKKNKSSGNKAGPKKQSTSTVAAQQEDDDQAVDAQISALLGQGDGADQSKEIMSSHAKEAHAIKDAIKATLQATEATLRAAAAKSEKDAGDGEEGENDTEERTALEEDLRKKINNLTLELNNVTVDEKVIAELNPNLQKPDQSPDDPSSSKGLDDISPVNGEVQIAEKPKPHVALEPSPTSNSPPSSTEPSAAAPEKPKASKTKESKKDKSMTIEQVIKSVASGHSDSERLQSLAAEYVKLQERHRTAETQLRSTTKEKNLLYDGHNRVLMAKNRLETLCRELQRQNREIKDTMMEKIKEEEQRRKDMATKFQGTLNDILTLIQENQQRNTLLRNENHDLAAKLKMLMDHYEKWEEHVDKIVKQKDLEVQLVRAKQAKTQLLLDQEKNAFLAEKAQMLAMLTDLQKRSQDFAQNEIKLRQELSMYTGKYEEFQGVLQKSNDMFVNFKTDMDKMSKQVKKLERETQEWKSKWESGNKQLLKLTQEKQKRDKELIGALTKVATLEKLCRALQIERNDLRKKLDLKAEDDQGSDNVSMSQESSQKDDKSEAPSNHVEEAHQSV